MALVVMPESPLSPTKVTTMVRYLSETNNSEDGWGVWGVYADAFFDARLEALAAATKWCWINRRKPGKSAAHKRLRFWWPERVVTDEYVGFGEHAMSVKTGWGGHRIEHNETIPLTHRLPAPIYEALRDATATVPGCRVNTLRGRFYDFGTALRELGKTLTDLKRLLCL